MYASFKLPTIQIRANDLGQIKLRKKSTKEMVEELSQKVALLQIEIADLNKRVK